MHTKKIISLLMTLGLFAGSFSFSNAKSLEVEKSEKLVEKTQVDYNYNNGGPVDLSIANEEKIIEMLKKEGKLKKDATLEEANKAFTDYMKGLSEYNNSKELTKEEKVLKAKEKGNQKSDKAKSSSEVTEVNVLAVLVDFSDYKHNQIQPGETEMYYESYEKEHYQDMIFGENGYKGPNGEQLVSMTQFYDEQSGGTLKIKGKVTDWYTVPGTAADYGAQDGSSNDVNARQLIKDGLIELGKDKSIDLSEFDKIDRYDLDGDGDYNEPDGMIDYLLFVHAGMGQEAGGGSLGSDAIWSHRWNLGGMYKIPGTEYTAYDYIINPEDGAAGVFCHEFGHDLGCPDEYDTKYSSPYNEPIGNWSLMSSGSWTGKIPGTEPNGISPYSRELLQNKFGGRWQNQTVVNYEDLNNKGKTFDLKQASETGQAVRINLPDVQTEIVKPNSGENMYWGGKGTDGAPIKSSMTTELDLSNATSPSLNFKTFYDIEKGWDFASVQAREKGNEEWIVLQGNITTEERDPQAEVILPHGITGKSDGWVDGVFGLSQFNGKNIELKIEYQTDSYTFGAGFYVDDIKVMDGDNELLSDNADGEDKFTLDGFTKDNGKLATKNYYLVEWRNHNGVDKGLANINSYGNTYSYDPGMVVWYVNEYYSENCTGDHPGGGYLSVIDADQKNIPWNYYDKDEASSFTSNRYQMHDAAFSSKNGTKFSLDAGEQYARTAVDKFSSANPKFTDKKDFSNQEIPELGVKLPDLDINIQILKQAKDNSGASISISQK